MEIKPRLQFICKRGFVFTSDSSPQGSYENEEPI